MLFGQSPGGTAAIFNTRAAEFDARQKTLELAVARDAQALAALEWLRALKAVLEAIPFERATGPYESWIKAHENLIVYDEPGGRWLIGNDLIETMRDRYPDSPVSEDIAWLAVTNGLPGECEGYVPCYASKLNTLDGEYLRRHPRGAHRAQALAGIEEVLVIVLDDLLKRPDHADFLSVPRDCDDLLDGMRPLRAAVAGANGANTYAMTLIDRLIAQCPAR